MNPLTVLSLECGIFSWITRSLFVRENIHSIQKVIEIGYYLFKMFKVFAPFNCLLMDGNRFVEVHETQCHLYVKHS